MFEAAVTQDNGMCFSRKFDTYAEMVNWLAAYPDAGIMAWEDSEPLETARFIQLQTDCAARQR